MAHPVGGRGSSRGPQPSFGDLDKPLYTISVAAEILETHPRTLMLYEDAGLIEPYRTSTNRRRYSQRDISTIQSTGKIHPTIGKTIREEADAARSCAVWRWRRRISIACTLNSRAMGTPIWSDCTIDSMR